MNHHSRVAHVFRHDYGLIVASLSRRFGVGYLDSVEDAVQFAMMQALVTWSRETPPNKPSAWLYQVACRKLLSELRTEKRRKSLLAEHSLLGVKIANEQPELPLPGEMSDALLRMLFVACDDAIAVESRLVFTLKSLCGFSVREIALRLFLSEANVYKRFTRAKAQLKKQANILESLNDSDMTNRLPGVHAVLYLIFTEGYLSSHTESAIRKDLCQQAVRLARLLSESHVGKVPETDALLALMYLHLSRLDARQDDAGVLLLLDQQDRRQWDQRHILKGLDYLQRSARGNNLSRYHLEASIAAEHCLAATLKQTRWQKIVTAYEWLERTSPSPLHCLNRAIATALWKGPQAGLAVIQSMEISPWLDQSYYCKAVMADLQFSLGEVALAWENAEKAVDKAPTEKIKHLLKKRWHIHARNI